MVSAMSLFLYGFSLFSILCTCSNKLPIKQKYGVVYFVTKNVLFFAVFDVFALFYFTLDAGLLAISQYSEGPATGHLDTGFSWFPYA